MPWLPDPSQVMSFLSAYAYEPWIVYGCVILFLTMSSFGFPVPEEVTLVSAGIVAYLGMHPDAYPPPHPGAEPVNPWILSCVCFFAVFFSDYLVFSLGRYGRKHADRMRFFERFLPEPVMKKVIAKTERYGMIMAGVFRFTPGLRFPGHFSCGFLGLAPWKFIAVDGGAALFSVPTQVILISFYGEEILEYLKRFKTALLLAFTVIVVVYVVVRVRRKYFMKRTGQFPELNER